MVVQATCGLASLLVLLCAFCGLGLGMLRALRVRITALDGIYAVAAGWGALVTVSIAAVYAAVPLRYVLYAGLILGCGGLAVGLRHGVGKLLLKPLGVSLLSILPAAISAASFSSLQYDEFMHWLPNALYLFANDTLPSSAFPNLQTGKQAYPIGVPYVTFAISAMEGVWNDRAPKVLPLVLGALFGVLVAGVFMRTDQPSAPAVAVGALLGTLLNPFFDPRIAVTIYADVPTALILAATVYALWRAGEEREAARDWMVRACLAALALMHLRETNIVFLAAAALSVPAAAVAARGCGAIDLRRSCLAAAAFAAAPAAAILIWRLHLRIQDISSDMVPRTLSEWSWSAPVVVLHSLATERLPNNPLMGATALAIGLALAIVGLLGWQRTSAGTKRLAVAIAMLAGAQVALLAFTYIAVFSEEEVQQASSAWRYASQLGPLLILAAAHVLSCGHATFRGIPQPMRMVGLLAPGLTVAAVVALQLLCVRYWRIDCVYPHVRPGYDALVSLLGKIPSQAPAVVVNAADSRLFSDAARLARVVATGDWRAQAPRIVDKDNGSAVGGYVIDLAGADPERFRKGQTFLHATTHRDRLASPAIDAVTVATSCTVR